MSTDDAATKPTIETVLERINMLGESLHGELKGVNTRLSKMEQQLKEFDITLDRIESHTNKTRSEFLELRADFREWRNQLKELLPQAG
jgi:2'-5' RNA ligase